MPNHIFQNDIIPITQAFLKRTHIHEMLEKAIEKPVTTVVASAGYGKTQAVYSFLQDYEAVTIWLQLSTFDNLPYRLWENFIHAFSAQNKKLAANLMSLGFPETTAAFVRWLDLISNTVKRDQRYVFVFDDFQLIREKGSFEFFDKFMNSRIPNLSFILISRNEPEINRMGLLSKDLISSIDEDDLRFSENEIVDYFSLKNIELSSQAVTEIHKYTDGWIFAINMVGLSLKKDSNLDDYAFSLVKDNVTKLMESEFSILSKGLQDFLIKLSLLDNLPLHLLQQLSSNDTSLIVEMGKVSSFIRYDAFTNIYRIHHVFLDFLCEKQNTLKPHDKMGIYKNAASWYAKNGYTTDAITYYEKAECYDEIIRIGLDFPRPCPKETAQFFIELFDRVPKAFYDTKPYMAILHGNFLLNNFRVEEAYTKYLQLREKYEAVPLADETKEVLGEIYLQLGFLGYIAYMKTGAEDFKELFKLAAEMLPSGSKVFTNLHLNTGHYACSVSKKNKGEFEKLNDILKYVIPFMSKVMHGCAYGLEYLALAETNYFRRNFANAERFAYQAIYMAQEKQQYDIENMAIFYLIRINIAKGQYKKISSLLKQVRLLATRYNYSEAFRQHDIIEGWFYATVGQTQKVASWITHDSADSNKSSPITFCLDRLVSVKCYLAEEKYEELLALIIGQQDHRYILENYLLGSIEMGLLKAVALYQVNKRKDALLALENAYELAHPNDLIMPFIELGNPMRSLTRMAMRDSNCKIPMEWLQMIYTKSSTYGKKLACVITDYLISEDFKDGHQLHLTKKETEILTDLCHGLTREEIADNCSMSSNTVKLMLQNIFEKLGATNTADAVRVAILMNLVK